MNNKIDSYENVIFMITCKANYWCPTWERTKKLNYGSSMKISSLKFIV